MTRTPPMPRTEPTAAETPPEVRSSLASRVFWPAAGLIVLFVLLALALPGPTNEVISVLNRTVVHSVGWYYVLAVSGFVIIALVIAASRLGDTRLGRDDDSPEYSLGSWFAMLFAAGMGIGLVFWGAAEPLSHFVTPPPGTGGDAAERARQAMQTSFLHWGLHAWAIYVIVGLAVAYACHRKGHPISLRWTLEPLLGDRVRGWVGDLIDIVAIIGTLFGVATSLGLGVTQVSSGLTFLTGITGSRGLLVGLVVLFAGLAAVSVATGLDAGIKFLSNTNLVIAALLALALLVVGPTQFLLSSAVQNIGEYVQSLIELSFRTMPFEGDAGQSWMAGWTTNYWGWWISWSPFVGIFIARISRGRTVREFIIGVMLVPTLVSVLWFTVFGGNAIWQQIFGTKLTVDGAVDANTTLFRMLETLPGGTVMAWVSMALLAIFFVTSSDSGSYVLSMLSCGGDPDPSLWVRLTWAVLSGTIAAVLLSGDPRGLSALQTMAILTALPFSVVMIGMCVALWRELSREVTVRRHNRMSDFGEAVRRTVREDLVDELRNPPSRPGRPIEVSPEVRRLIRVLRRGQRKRDRA
ncbi:BCCT family transporter [Acidipropionibacterium timonense]|uniref:BCCT family transporter n=1 Tax=Acidipropionibacterium timonense TaxID=2161818 RepID=UPI001AEBD77E|nr:BCCT family transporter [Acidipropionibacterium timonense]